MNIEENTNLPTEENLKPTHRVKFSMDANMPPLSSRRPVLIESESADFNELKDKVIINHVKSTKNPHEHFRSEGMIRIN